MSITRSPQILPYNRTAARLYAKCEVDGLEVPPTSAPTYVVYDKDGSQLASGTMTILTRTTRGFLKYKTCTVPFLDGEKITQATSAATAIIVSQRKAGTTGIFSLGDISGTFADTYAITGSVAGAAVADGALVQTEYYVDLDTSSTSKYPVAQDYRIEVTFAYASVTYKRQLYFDVEYVPPSEPVITSDMVDNAHPTWTRQRPKQWADWTIPIGMGHANLLTDIHQSGERAAHYVKFPEDFMFVEMAYVEAQIAESLDFDEATYNRYQQKKINVWTSKGQMTRVDDGVDVADTVPVTISAKLVR